MKQWLRNQWLRRRGTVRALDIILIVQCIWWGTWCVIADPPLHQAWPRLFGWSLVVGGAQGVGVISIILGATLGGACIWRRMSWAKELVLLLCAGWWIVVAGAFAAVSIWLTSTPTYCVMALVAVSAYVLNPPAAEVCRGRA